MKNNKIIVLEWTEINGKKIPKKIIEIVPKDKIPNSHKGNGLLIDNIFTNGDI